MTGREILSLQFGHYANFVGAHLWNIQESSFDYNSHTPSPIDHDVFYREGLTQHNQVTFTPRTLLVDLKGSLKSLPEDGGLYVQAADVEKTKKAALWRENEVEVQTEEKCENKVEALLEAKENAVLEENVSVWSDFLYSRFHPRTVNVVKEFEHGNEEKAFDVFPLGRDLWQSEEFQDIFTDKIRQYLEECDNFQGFQVLLDANNAFCGLATSCLEYLQDEYERKSIFALPLLPAHHADYDFRTVEDECKSLIKDSVRVLNTALGFSLLAENSSLFVPLSVGSSGWRQPGAKRSFNHVTYDHTSSFHSTAILATALDTFSLQYRLKNSPYSLRDLCSDLTPHSRKMAAASVCLPFSVNEGDSLLDCLDNWDGSLTKTITPNCNIGTDRVMQTFTMRGVPETQLKKASHKNLPAYKYDNVKDMLTYYLACTTYATANQVTAVEKPLKIGPFYPKIFDNRVGRNGNIVHERPVGIGVESVPVMAGLHTGTEIAPTLESLHAEAAKIKYQRLHQFKSGMEIDEFKESLEKLLELKDCYED